jgi:hypothetical protein
VRNFFWHSCHSSPVTRHSEKGIALVITLILLSVTLVMAVAFLAISRRERRPSPPPPTRPPRGSPPIPRWRNAEAQIVATMLATTNPYNYGLLVSTNYINPFCRRRRQPDKCQL